MVDLDIQQVEGGVVFVVKVVPGSSKTCVGGRLGDKIKVKIASVAEKGRANENLIDFLAGKIGTKKKDISIISGMTKPVKRIRVNGISRQRLLKTLDLDG